MSFSTPSDKRDMLLVFGLDRKYQTKDSFFHNANSIIRRKVWNKFYFDEKVTNIEDRIWAQKIIKNNYKLMYEPEASVYHYHGIHQNSDIKRLKGVVKIIEEKLSHIKTPITLSIIGCVVNGPGEASQTQVGLTGGGKDNHMLYLSGVPHQKIASEKVIEQVVSLVEKKSQEFKNN